MPSLSHSLPLAPTATELRSGQRDLLEFVNEICDRIDALEPQIQALLSEPERRARLLTEAASLQRRYPDPTQRPPLYGVLLGVKDIFRVDGFSTRAGSQLPSTLFTGPQASCVTILQKAGAIVLAKTVTAEFASDEPGPTRNPHNLAHTPGGSSSGSAAAVAAGFCQLALGTQTVGSVIRPAAFCGIIGFKPTYGRISADGLIPYAVSSDTIGIMTQDVAGAALAASLLCHDWRATTMSAKPVLAIPNGPYLAQASREALRAFEQQLRLLTNAGYTIKRVAVLDDIQSINTMHQQLTTAEMAQVHQRWLAAYQQLYRPRTVEKIHTGQKVSHAQSTEARSSRSQVRVRLEAVMKREGIDLWICPAAIGPAPEGITSTGSTLMNLPWTHAGMPVLTLPAGKATDGLPLGLQMIAPVMADEHLLAWAEPMAGILQKS
ncbi:glutamyl-tRNA amidotransferase subunit A [Reticulibacter mediterranei]|uniref:Glutamyl-tRNA amidotransferase subunit A n=1 Tax=Reticulibacter mediterranei TaxID=2778369 RepID=A0A8J3N5U7_9CHLR|nr:amidase [Reticulibacter mediterranei]GHO96863.1 glutamyl-tRNA amidotransferase subunit A [Reticulibacter mediterranei]